jgi:hypothetical protein
VIAESLTFELRGTTGHVHIGYGRNDDPERWGFDLLGLDFDTQAALGFPVLHASVEFPAEGYLGYLAWIQVVTYTVIRGSERSTTELVDVPPQLREAAVPYLAFGVEPAFFDAPAFTEPDVDWRARSFLTASPDLLMTPSVDPICGFSWGYTIRQGTVTPAPLRPCDRDDWSTATRMLSERFPAWSFGGEAWESIPFDAI